MTRCHDVTKIAVALTIVAFFLAGFAGTSHASMTMQADGQMTDCPLLPGVFICTMTPLGMIAASQYLLASFPQQKDSVVLLIALLLATLARVRVWKLLVPLWPTRERAVSMPCPVYIPLANPLQEIFSSGILNPKPY